MMMNQPTSPTAAPGPTWWVEAWSSQIATALAVLYVLCGLMTTISPLAVHCIPAGILQLYVHLYIIITSETFIYPYILSYRLASVAILSIEAPSFVAFLQFARGVGRFVEGKPYWFKTAIYAA